MSKHSCAGITLIELLVSLVLSAGLLLSVLHLLSHSQASYQLHINQTTQLQTERYLAQRFTNAIHHAGFLGCSTITRTVFHNQLMIPAPFALEAIHAYHINNNPQLPQVLKENAALGTEALQIQYLDRPYAELTQPMKSPTDILHISSTKGFSKNDAVIISDCEDTDLFSISQMGNRYGTLNHALGNNRSNDLSKSYTPPAIVGHVTHVLFYIRKPNEKTTNANGLYFEQNNYSSEIVSDIDNLTLMFQTVKKTNWVTLTAVKNWQQVTAIKIELIYHNGAQQTIIASLRNL
jgi:hypothetical protein